MKFYKELSKNYDDIFPLNPKTSVFLNKTLNDNSVILDLACGTGNYSIDLCKNNRKIYGIDFSKEMITSARNKADSKNKRINFIVGDMCNTNYYNEEKFDFIFCIGNSIVHLENIEKIEKFIMDISNLLKSNGVLVIQIINFDRILKNNITHLPTIKNNEKGIKFIRKYEYKNKKISFNTELIIGENLSFKNSVSLIPLKKCELEHILDNSGFSQIKWFGSFLEEEWNKESYATIVKAIIKN